VVKEIEKAVLHFDLNTGICQNCTQSMEIPVFQAPLTFISEWLCLAYSKTH